MSEFESRLQPGDALVVIDVQNDFCPDGALPIQEGDAVVPVVNDLIRACVARGVPIYASRDWHPQGHLSFADRGGDWPVHCVQDTPGAAFHADLELPENAVIVTKGVRFDQDQLSIFDQTGLGARLRSDGVARVWFAGLAEDVCVMESVLGAIAEGFAAGVVDAGTRPVTAEGAQVADRRMRAAGAIRIVR